MRTICNSSLPHSSVVLFSKNYIIPVILWPQANCMAYPADDRKQFILFICQSSVLACLEPSPDVLFKQESSSDTLETTRIKFFKTRLHM